MCAKIIDLVINKPANVLHTFANTMVMYSPVVVLVLIVPGTENTRMKLMARRLMMSSSMLVQAAGITRVIWSFSASTCMTMILESLLLFANLVPRSILISSTMASFSRSRLFNLSFNR
ncbi:hypothetical protein V8B55DRAFT_1382031 [Mucor lusitanicus]|uniref:Uncharacterized protein n=1 Tax=Mucor circinelloides f. lusitanicus TaxID=29924 RepID=A0A8H4BMB5_MUCCL|nr:hypothetical protein FB192DRAFT_1359732 [Mucor lusitanicus]